MAFIGSLEVFLKQKVHSIVLLLFQLDAWLDCMSSIVVVWRFTGAAGKVYSVKRESM